MSITDELRKEARAIQTFTCMAEQAEQLTAIADSIDAEHERICYDYQREHDDWVYIRDTRWVELPKDADGVPWNPGDRDEDGNVVTHLMLTSDGWYVITDGIFSYHPERRRHYHAPTVEDVLRDVVTLCHNTWKEESAFEFYDVDDVMKSGNIAEFAAKLRLAETEDA